MTRAFILVMDSFGVGAAGDAGAYGDVGADTLGHIAEHCSLGLADAEGRRGLLTLPNLSRLGLGLAARPRLQCSAIWPSVSAPTSP